MNFSDIENWVIPEGTVTKVTDSLNRVIWEKSTPADEYFYVEDISGADNTLSIVQSYRYAPTIEVFKSTDQTNWTLMGRTSTTPMRATVPANGKLYLKATTTRWGLDAIKYNFLNCSGNYNVGGDIMSLLNGDNYKNTVLDTQYAHHFRGLFSGSNTLINSNKLYLPSNVANYSYYYMFANCTSLIQAPVLPATTLATYCYGYIFSGCTSLNQVITYANDISATSCLSNWLYNVAATGDFYNLGGATYPSGASGIPTGWTEHNTL